MAVRLENIEPADQTSEYPIQTNTYTLWNHDRKLRGDLHFLYISTQTRHRMRSRQFDDPTISPRNEKASARKRDTDRNRI